MPRGYKHDGTKMIPPNWKGKKRSLQMRKRLSVSRLGRSNLHIVGDNNPLWKGGISKDLNKYMMNYRKIANEYRAGRKMSERCEICGVFAIDLKRGLSYDHNHKTGKFRGWICGRCNTAMGLVLENVETLSLMIDYIKNDGRHKR